MYEKSSLEELFVVVNCMSFEYFYNRNFQPLLSSSFLQFMIANPAGKYVFDVEIM
jgi:hypothetical protein